ncbi:hypothetical protein N0V84_007307 [Fusarium piperis]|uniref:Uncharacterized protein n=1 Tax=Fusarium piperis TaxID=1435070 RepID=A0A9W9BNJ2_9HYPO|nr:hypothetical protein N0V84_007307 [Fusarium piperis]
MSRRNNRRARSSRPTGRTTESQLAVPKSTKQLRNQKRRERREANRNRARNRTREPTVDSDGDIDAISESDAESEQQTRRRDTSQEKTDPNRAGPFDIQRLRTAVTSIIKEQFQYSSSVPKDIKFPSLAQSKVVAVRSKNNDKSWRRISQSMGLAKAREHSRFEKKPPISNEPRIPISYEPKIPIYTDPKTEKKRKWKWWWGKRKEKDPVKPEHHDVYNAPKNKEPEMIARSEPRHSMLEWLDRNSLPAQSPQALKELFEKEY